MKVFTAVLLVLCIMISFACCKTTSNETTTHYDATTKITINAPTTDTAATNDIQSSLPVQIEENSTKETKIQYSKEKAKTLGTFDSPIYGKLTLCLQEGYFLILDEFGDLRFTVFAENYSSAKTDNNIIYMFKDMNFDGYEDFCVCYYTDTLNSYYFCFLWDSTERTFKYYLPLSSVANPEFNEKTKTISSKEKTDFDTYTLKTYAFSSNELKLISSQAISEKTEPTTGGPQTVTPNTKIAENGNSALVTLSANENSHSKWVCEIEDESIVELGSEYYDDTQKIYEFLLNAKNEGATTVVFKYVSVYTGEYVEQVVINAIVDKNSDILIVVTEQ